MAKFIYTGKLKDEIETKMIDDPDVALEVAAESYQVGYDHGIRIGKAFGCAATVLTISVCKWLDDNPDKVKKVKDAVGGTVKKSTDFVTGKIKSHFTKDDDEEA